MLFFAVNYEVRDPWKLLLTILGEHFVAIKNSRNDLVRNCSFSHPRGYWQRPGLDYLQEHCQEQAGGHHHQPRSRSKTGRENISNFYFLLSRYYCTIPGLILYFSNFVFRLCSLIKTHRSFYSSSTAL